MTYENYFRQCKLSVQQLKKHKKEPFKRRFAVITITPYKSFDLLFIFSLLAVFLLIKIILMFLKYFQPTSGIKIIKVYSFRTVQL